MATEIKLDPPSDDRELLIRLDLDGLAALLRAVESALVTGRGHLTSDAAGGRGISVVSGSARVFDQVTVTFSRPRTLQ